MPPFPLDAFRPQPRLEARRSEAPVLEVIHLITRAPTTLTTMIGLTPTTAPASNPTSVPPTTGAVIPIATNPNTPNTSVIVGAIIGSILGAMVILTMFYKCCVDNRSAIHVGERYSGYDSNSDSGRSSRSSGVRTRGGGFDSVNRHNSVRIPCQARTRRHRRMIERSKSRSETSWGPSDRRRRRRNSMTQKNGILGWRLAPRKNYHNRYKRRWPHDRRGNNFSPDD